MCACAIRLARVSVVVSGARSSDVSSTLNGQTVLSDAGILPNHPSPLVGSGMCSHPVPSRACRAVIRPDCGQIFVLNLSGMED